MTNQAEIQVKFWQMVARDRIMMIGILDDKQGHARPMTAMLDGETGPIGYLHQKTPLI